MGASSMIVLILAGLAFACIAILIAKVSIKQHQSSWQTYECGIPTGQNLDSDECGFIICMPPFLIFDVELVFLIPGSGRQSYRVVRPGGDHHILFHIVFRFPVCAHRKGAQVGLTH